jgi:hypothetical protein
MSNQAMGYSRALAARDLEAAASYRWASECSRRPAMRAQFLKQSRSIVAGLRDMRRSIGPDGYKLP